MEKNTTKTEVREKIQELLKTLKAEQEKKPLRLVEQLGYLMYVRLFIESQKRVSLQESFPFAGFPMEWIPGEEEVEDGQRSYVEKHPEIIQAFTDGLQKGVDYVNSHTAEEIAKVIQPQFKENDLDTITRIVERYQSQDTWKENLVFEKESFELLQDILESAGELEKRADYEKLVTTIYAKEAMKK